jgi:hypothetical protein
VRADGVGQLALPADQGDFRLRPILECAGERPTFLLSYETPLLVVVGGGAVVRKLNLRRFRRWRPSCRRRRCLIETCKMNYVDPKAWLAGMPAMLPDHPVNKVADLLPWNWKANQQRKAAVAA